MLIGDLPIRKCLGGNMVTCKSEKKNMIVWTRAKVEYCSMSQRISELLQVKVTLGDVKIK